MCDEGCICKGNWRQIVKESEPLIGSLYANEDGYQYYFMGVLHGDDDYYYVMMRCDDRKLMLLSCVGSIEGHRFTLVSSKKKYVTEEELLLRKIFGEDEEAG